MENDLRYIESLTKASLNAERAFLAAFAPEYAHYPANQLQIWAAAAILHCDILRYVVTFENATREGLVRLLWMGDIVSMLYEAKEWFYRKGGPDLVAIAGARGYDQDHVREQLKTFKTAYTLNGVKDFADYRNKVGHHYDADFVAHLRNFSETDSSNFYVVLTNYAKFANQWVVLCKDILAHNSGPKR